MKEYLEKNFDLSSTLLRVLCVHYANGFDNVESVYFFYSNPLLDLDFFYTIPFQNIQLLSISLCYYPGLSIIVFLSINFSILDVFEKKNCSI
jgi:hypothetical protein